jgi:hypothetical protein
VVLATGGGGATYDDQTRIVHTKVRPVLKTADFLAAAPVAFIGLRLLDGNYAGPLIKVRRVNMGATLDIYPTSTGALDAAAIATHCGSAVGTIAVIYDQSGAGRNATTAVMTREYRIWPVRRLPRSAAVASPSPSSTLRTAVTPSASRR